MKKKITRIGIIFLVFIFLFGNYSYVNGAFWNNWGKKAKDVYESVKKIKDKILHPIESATKSIVNIWTGFIDKGQFFLNGIQTTSDDTYSSSLSNIMQKYDDLKDDKPDENVKGSGNVNKYTCVDEYENGEAKEVKIKVLKDENQNDIDDFTDKTKIPFIVMDMYNIAIDHIDFLDVNFLSGNTEEKKDGTGLRHKENSRWTTFRDVGVMLMRMMIYIACAALLMSLIWHGINILRHTFDNPTARANSMSKIKSLARSIMILIGTLLFMGACIYGSRAICGVIFDTDSYEQPIRVDVEDTYSFSTNITGYFRYRAQSKDLHQAIKTAGYAALYTFCVLINGVILVVMLGRMVFLWLLSILGTFISIFYAFGKRPPISFRSWAYMYVGATMIQVVLAIGYKGILVAFF